MIRRMAVIRGMSKGKSGGEAMRSARTTKGRNLRQLWNAPRVVCVRIRTRSFDWFAVGLDEFADSVHFEDLLDVWHQMLLVHVPEGINVCSYLDK